MLGIFPWPKKKAEVVTYWSCRPVKAGDGGYGAGANSVGNDANTGPALCR